MLAVPDLEPDAHNDRVIDGDCDVDGQRDGVAGAYWDWDVERHGEPDNLPGVDGQRNSIALGNPDALPVCDAERHRKRVFVAGVVTELDRHAFGGAFVERHGEPIRIADCDCQPGVDALSLAHAGREFRQHADLEPARVAVVERDALRSSLGDANVDSKRLGVADALVLGVRNGQCFCVTVEQRIAAPRREFDERVGCKRRIVLASGHGDTERERV